MIRTRVPELAIGQARTKLQGGLPLLEEDIMEFLKDIGPNSSIIEIEGGLGEVSEYLSKSNKVFLLEELRLFFVYRRQIFEGSKVIEMNTGVNSINPSSRKYYDYAIIHDDKHLDFAKKIAHVVYNVSTKEVHGKKSVNYSEELGAIPKNKNSKKKLSEGAEFQSHTFCSG